MPFRDPRIEEDVSDGSSSSRSISPDVTNTASNPRKKRSRNGCLSCKKLKIKCNEDKPKCEYCCHTGRNCVYPPAPRSSRNEVYQVMRKESLRSSILMNSNWRNLNISKFEYRLLHFFQIFCVPLFSFNVHAGVDRVWRYEVPKLWQSSDLVKQSVFSFSALNLWPLCVNNAGYIDDPDRSQFYAFLNDSPENAALMNNLLGDTTQTIKGSFANVMLEQNEEGNLFRKTTEYFATSLKKTNEIIAQSTDFLESDNYTSSKEYTKDELVHKSSEIVISGILIFSFLGLHPHRLVPLVYFKESEDDEAQTDMLAICVGVHYTIRKSVGHLITSEFAGMFHNVERYTVLPPNNPRYPLVEKLKSRFHEWIEMNNLDKVFDSDSAVSINTFKDSIHLLEVCVYRCVEKNYPIPLFRWILAIDPNLEGLIRSKNPFALKMLFYYSSLCMVCRFSLFKNSSIWLDYMNWYRDYNLNIYGAWLHDDDEGLYNLVVDKGFEFHLQKFTNLESLDPERLDEFIAANVPADSVS